MGGFWSGGGPRPAGTGGQDPLYLLATNSRRDRQGYSSLRRDRRAFEGGGQFPVGWAKAVCRREIRHPRRQGSLLCRLSEGVPGAERHVLRLHTARQAVQFYGAESRRSLDGRLAG